MVLEHIYGQNPHGLTVGIDISAPMLEQAHAKLGENHHVLLIKQDISRELPFLDNYFDYIVASNVFQEIPDQRALLAEIMRILKPQGLFAAMMVCLEGKSSANLAYSRIAEEYLWYFKIFSDMKQMVLESRLKIIVEEQQFAKNPMASLVEKDNKMQFSGFHTIMKRVVQEGESPEQVSQGHYKFIAQKESGMRQ